MPKRPQEAVAALPPLPDLLAFPRGRRRAVAPQALPPDMEHADVLSAVLKSIAGRTADRPWSAVFEQLAERVAALEAAARLTAQLQDERDALERTLAGVRTRVTELTNSVNEKTRQLSDANATIRTQSREHQADLDDLRAEIRSLSAERTEELQEQLSDEKSRAEDLGHDLDFLAEDEALIRERRYDHLVEAHARMGHEDGLRSCGDAWCREACLDLADIPKILVDRNPDGLRPFVRAEYFDRWLFS